MDSSSNEVAVSKKKNFFYQQKKTHCSSCIFPINSKDNMIKLKFGFNVTTNMYYQKNSEILELNESLENMSKKRKMQSNSTGKFKLHFVLWETKNHKNKFDWVKLAVCSSSLFNIVSHSDQINQNKTSNSPNPECIFPDLIPENTNFPITIVGHFPNGITSYSVIFKEENGNEKIINLKQQNTKMLVGSSPSLKSGSVSVFVLEKGNLFPHSGMRFKVISLDLWKKETGFTN